MTADVRWPDREALWHRPEEALWFLEPSVSVLHNDITETGKELRIVIEVQVGPRDAFGFQLANG